MGELLRFSGFLHRKVPGNYSFTGLGLCKSDVVAKQLKVLRNEIQSAKT